MNEHYIVVQAFDGEAVLCSKTRRLFGPAKALAGELNRLAYKAETAEKLCDYWEARAKAVKNERDEAIRKASVWEKIALREAKINGARLLNKEAAE